MSRKYSGLGFGRAPFGKSTFAWKRVMGNEEDR